jgi:SpoU rRNA methylase family enzyme/uncharacterized metal-binding protein YceD (DUF177 family)
MYALSERAQNKLLGYRSFHKTLLRYQKQMLPAIHERPNLEVTTDLNSEATTGLEATSSTTTVAELSTNASAVQAESLTLSSACASIASDQRAIMDALSERAQNKLLGYRSFHKTLLRYQKQMLPAIHERPNSEATTDLNSEATTGLEATSSSTTVAELSTTACAVSVETLTLSSACASNASNQNTRIQFGTGSGNTHALPQQAQEKLLRYHGSHKELLDYQNQIRESHSSCTTELEATTDRNNSEATSDLNMEATTDLDSEATNDLTLEVTTGLEAASSTTTVAELSTSAPAVPFESLSLSSACGSNASDQHTTIQFGTDTENTHALPQRAQEKLLRFHGSHKELLDYQNQIRESYSSCTTELEATTDRNNSEANTDLNMEATIDLNSEATTDLKLEATTGFEATNSTTTVAELSTSASAVL